MSFTNPAAYSNTSLQSFFDFTKGDLYKDINPTELSIQNYLEPSLDENGEKIKLPDNKFDSQKVICSDLNKLNNSIELMQEYGIDVAPSYFNSGMFIGDSSNVTGHFSNNYSSLGANFNSSAVLIQNSREFMHGQSCYFFSHTKQSKGSEILFSSLNKNEDLGFEVGLNDANKLYIEYPETYGTQTLTLNTINDNKNIYYVEIDLINNKLVLGRWDGFQEIFEKKTCYFRACECFKSNGMDWVVGSGTYMGEDGINLNSEPYKCKGFIDKFAYFDGFISDATKEEFVRTFYENLEYSPRTYEKYQGGIIGYNNVIDHTVSGIVEYEDIITGYKNYNVDYDVTGISELVGDVSKGQVYYDFDSEFEASLKTGFTSTSGIYIEKQAEENLLSVVTGFVESTNTYSYSWSDEGPHSEPLYYHSGVSGKLYDVYRSEPIYAEEREIITDKGSYIMSGAYPLLFPDNENGFGPTNYTYLGARNKRVDYLEHYQGINTFSVDNFADIEVFNKFKPETAISLSSDLEYEYKNISLYINGVSQSWGPLEFVDDNCNLIQDKWELTSGDFGVYQWPEGSLDVGINKIYYNDENISLLVDHPLIDVVSGSPGTGVFVNEGSSFIDNGFVDQEISDEEFDKVFFNGQKLNKDIDYYYDSNDVLQLINSNGFFDDVTGWFHSEKDFIRDEDCIEHNKIRGLAEFDISYINPFIPGSNVSYLNGIRLDPKSYVSHGDYDLINPSKEFIMETESITVYNNTATYSDTDPPVMNLFQMPEFSEDWALEDTVDEAGNIVDAEGNIRVESSRRSASRGGGDVAEANRGYLPSRKIVEIDFSEF